MYLSTLRASDVKLIHFFEDLLALKPKLAINKIPRSSCGFCHEDERDKTYLI